MLLLGFFDFVGDDECFICTCQNIGSLSGLGANGSVTIVISHEISSTVIISQARMCGICQILIATPSRWI